MVKKLNVQKNVGMNPLTLEEAHRKFTYVLLKGDKMYCKNAWYQYWVEVPLVHEKEVI